jgi:uncharacterized protein (DUF169 family)
MISKDFAKIAKVISDSINLKKHIVAVKLFDDLNDVPDDLPRPDNKIFYCGAVAQAMQGKTLLLLEEDHLCDRGAYVLGVKEPNDNVINGKMYAKGHMVESDRAGKRLIEEAPKIPVGKTKAILLTPLEESKFDPDVVIIAANPYQSLVILNATNYKNGLEIPIRTQIFTSFCAYATVLPFKYGKPNATLPQKQARVRSQLPDEEMLVGIPGELIEEVSEIISGLCCIRKPDN